MDIPYWLAYTLFSLLVLFVVLGSLKLMGILNVAWWVVALPLLGPVVFLVLVVVFISLWMASGSH